MAVNTVKVNIDGSNYNLTYNSTSGKWEASITAPSVTSWNESENKYGATVTATDEAGNDTVVDRSDPTLGDSLELRVLETTKPTINVTSPSSGATLNTSSPTVSFEVRDSGSGIDTSTIQLVVDGSATYTSSDMTVTSVADGYDCTCVLDTPTLSDGSHSININVDDNDGNSANTASHSFTVDTVVPTLNISSPTDGLITNNASVNVVGTTNDETSSPVTVTVELNGSDQGTVNVSDGSFSKAISLDEGSNTIVVRSTDASGLYSEVTRTVTLDTVAPTISGITITPNPVDVGNTYTIEVTVTDS